MRPRTRSIPFIPVLLCLSTLLSAQKDDQRVRISGKIENADDSILTAYFRPFYNYSNFKTELDEDGKFELSPELQGPRYLKLRHGDRRTTLFLNPGDSIRLKGDAKKPFSSYSFHWDGTARNKYLSERTLLDDSLRNVLRSAFVKGPKPFSASLDTILRPYEGLLAEHKGELSDPFYEQEKRRLRLKKAAQRLKYETWHAYMQKAKGEKESVEVPDAFYSPVHELDLYRPGDIASPTYYSFVDQYAMHLHDRKLEQDSSLEDSARVKVQYRAFKKKTGNDTARSVLLAKSNYNMLMRYGSEGVGPLLNELEASGMFPAITDSLEARYEEWQAIAPRERAPGFSLPSIEGDTLALEELHGKHVYIDAWATWCGPCRKEIPHLKKLEEKFHGEDLAFVSISLDEEGMKEKWEQMVKKKELGGHQLIANGEAFDSKFAEDYLIRSIPRFILIGPDGKIIDNNAERPSGKAEEQLREAVGKER